MLKVEQEEMKSKPNQIEIISMNNLHAKSEARIKAR